ncbi:MAG TPA: 4Fe-4S dicluster domain-containing protein [Caldimonas sp.]|nr:4Fe-4S dicluster domain-containing protein [Caldimonas sp.]
MAASLTRRRAMQLMAASLALGGSACTRSPRQRIYPYVDMPEAGTAGVPIYYASAFVRDGHAHGVLVGTREGRPIKVEGNPLHPSSLGATDVFAQASVLELWDPDRAQAVRERLGTDGGPSPAAATSTWPAFEAAWQQREERHLRNGGSGLRVLTRTVTSPSLHAQLDRLRERFAAMRWHRHDPVAPLAEREGSRLAFGRPVQLLWHLERARFVLALDADPFSHGPGSVRAARDWAAQRTAAAGPARALAIETTPGLFGARADERLPLPPAAIEAILARIAARLYGDLPAAAAAQPMPEGAARFEQRVFEQLRQNGADSLVIVGPSLSAPTHALVHLLNQRLGAFGRTLDAIEPPDRDETAGSLTELTEAIDAGAVDTLLILGGNPAYDAPGNIAFAAALARVPLSIHLSLHANETSRLCRWQLPTTHDFEQWSDALGHDGSATLIQPAIAPLYDGRSAHELLALVAADDVRDGHALLRRHWRASGAAPKGDFDAFWRDSLGRGVVRDSAPPALSLPPAQVPVPATAANPPSGELAAVFVADPSASDGRFANNGWLQELPRPFTKLTWDNALHLAPATAAALGLATGDIVRAVASGRAVEAPVWVQAGHAEGAATLPLGYGRTGAGRVGDGIGFDAYRLRLDVGGAVSIRLEKTGRRHDFAVTQRELDQHGRRLARTVRRGEGIGHEDAGHPSLYPAVAYPTHAWGMVIDLDACIGCNACTIACQAENNIPVVGAEEVVRGRHMHWIRVDRYDDDDAGSLFQPVPCMHCENAPCEVVCPVGATVHDSEGLNVQVYNRCIGTRFCSNNCPYKVRRFNFLQYADRETETLKAGRNPDVTVRQRGVMEKCTYCLQRLSRARILSEESGRPIADGDVVSACQAVCPTQAIRFGDLNDANADVVRAKASPRHYAMLGELNTRPRTTYLARVVAAKEEP